jgi:site-specific recombinase XerC
MTGALTKAMPGAVALPALFAPDPDAARCFVEFFTANIRNPNTRTAYAWAAAKLAVWCEQKGLHELRDIEPVHVAAYVETLQTRLAAPSVKLHLAGIRMLFNWLVVGQVIAVNPASSVRGPRHSVKKGKTPVLTAEEARALLDSIARSSAVALRDRALIALMVYTFARVGAALKMRIEDVYIQGRRTWVRLHEKGGKRHEMPCHHNLDTYLHAYIDGAQLAGDDKGLLFRTALGRNGFLSDRPMTQSDAYRMIRPARGRG